MHGDRELAVRFEVFPDKLRERLVSRIESLTQELYERVEAATPVKTGELVGEETIRDYADQPGRIAGYVGVFAPQDPANQYAKAATLEYGTNKPRRAFERKKVMLTELTSARRRLVGQMSRSVHIEAIRYLRDPTKEMEPEVLAAIEEEVEGAVQDASS